MTGTLRFENQWLHFDHAGSNVSCHTFLDEATGRMRIDKVIVEDPAGISGEAMRTMPIRRYEAFLNKRYARPDERSPRIKLRIPDKTWKKPDDFYRQVAAAYEYLAERTSRPAKEIADRNDLPVSMVHRWIKEARSRGLLAPGQKGKAV